MADQNPHVEHEQVDSDQKCSKKRKQHDETNIKEKRIKTGPRRKPGFDKEFFEETTYYTKGGLRHIVPYYFTFSTHCKGRWVSSTLFDVFKNEFRSETPEYYERAIKSGKITVNGKTSTMDYILKDNDLIENRVHRHEPPVTDEALKIISLTDDLVVLNKPSSIPVHPCGRYRHNTMVFLLGKEHGLNNLHTCHRIDRLTSGVLIFARTASRARELETQVKNRKVYKEYVCRVKGDFPSEPVEVDQPILVVSHKIGICRVSPDAKPCKTLFSKVSSNGETSVVKCIPYTGRMHQIRVHLQWLGFPIIDDPIYNNDLWGDGKGKGGVSNEKVTELISAMVESNKSLTVTGTRNNSNKNYTGIQNVLEKKCCDEGLPKSIHTPESSVNGTETEPLGTASLLRLESTHGSESSTNGASISLLLESSSELESSTHGAETAPLGTESATQPLLRQDSTLGKEFGISTEENQETDEHLDDDCRECGVHRRDPTPAELTMCLHALVYKGPNWEFKTEMPSWTADDWTPHQQTKSLEILPDIQ